MDRRITSSEARRLPMLPTAKYPGPTVSRTRPGAISSKVWASDANTMEWRVTGLLVAGYRVNLSVLPAAIASVKNTSRPLCWWSWTPTPENPAFSHSPMNSAVSSTGKPTGTRISTFMQKPKNPKNLGHLA